MNELIKYFDLASESRTKKTSALSDDEKTLHWLPQYIVLVLGVIIQPFFAAYQQTGEWNFEGYTGRVLFALIAGILIFPGVYKKAFDPEKPLFVQLCAVFAIGMGWESLLRTALKAAGV